MQRRVGRRLKGGSAGGSPQRIELYFPAIVRRARSLRKPARRRQLKGASAVEFASALWQTTMEKQCSGPGKFMDLNYDAILT